MLLNFKSLKYKFLSHHLERFNLHSYSDFNNIFLDMNQKILIKKKLTSRILVDSNFTFTSYAWLCALALLRWLLCKIKSRRRDFM